MLINLLIATLAVYAVSVLLTASDGPSNIFLKLRDKYPESALQCLKCTSVWVSAPVFIMFCFGLTFWLIPLAIVGVVILIDELT